MTSLRKFRVGTVRVPLATTAKFLISSKTVKEVFKMTVYILFVCPALRRILHLIQVNTNRKCFAIGSANRALTHEASLQIYYSSSGNHMLPYCRSGPPQPLPIGASGQIQIVSSIPQITAWEDDSVMPCMLYIAAIFLMA